MNTYCVIMAGGFGERFWPLSRMQKPKQLLKLTSTTSTMLEEAIERILPIVPMERILIVTSEVLQQTIREAMPQLPAENVIAEPTKRNTAPCLALACAHIQAREKGADACMAVLTADHFIGDVEAFRNDVRLGLGYAETHDVLMTIGLVPTRPETGYGYIHVGQEPAHDGVYTVHQFKEKPSAAVALQYVQSGNYFWNSGMFIWRTSVLEEAMQAVLPEVGASISVLYHALLENQQAIIASAFKALPDISIDYGVMERATNVQAVKATFPWDDVGSWDALLRLNTPDEEGNVCTGETITLNTTHSVVLNSHENHVVTVLGLHNTIVVHTPDATLVCASENAQDVKAIVQLLRAEGKGNVL